MVLHPRPKQYTHGQEHKNTQKVFKWVYPIHTYKGERILNNTAKQKKKRLQTIVNQIQENPEDGVEKETLIDQIIWEWGSQRRKAREYIQTITGVGKAKIKEEERDGDDVEVLYPVEKDSDELEATVQ